ncbi:MAG TPA: APC family permease [Actinoplanes sp.]
MALHDRPSSAVLASRRLGAAGVLTFALAAAIPFPAAVTAVPAAYALGTPTVPLAFAIVGLVLAVFSVGYVAMARRSPHAAALSAFIARGLGRPAGVGSAWIALLSYNAVQISLYGLVGAAAEPMLRSWFGIDAPWWTVALACWLVVAVCGLARVEVVGGFLALLVIAEVAVLTGFAAADLFHPAPAGIITAPFDVTALTGADRPVLGLLLVTAALAFVGFETFATYGEELRRPRRALSRAAYGVVAVTTALLVLVAWTTSVAAGSANATPAAVTRGPELIFDLAAVRLAPWGVTLGRVLLFTGLLAGLIALHHTIARYLFALGRERLVPSWLGRTSPRTLAPQAASLTQSVIAAVVLSVCGYFRLGPETGLFHRLGVGGALGVLVLLLGASLAALLFLNRHPDRENLVRRFVAPALATVALGTLAVLAYRNLPVLLGVAPHDALVRTVPVVFGAELVLGMLYAVVLRGARPVVYAGIGLGGTAVVVSPHVPQPRAPGAHRPERVETPS